MKLEIEKCIQKNQNCYMKKLVREKTQQSMVLTDT